MKYVNEQIMDHPELIGQVVKVVIRDNNTTEVSQNVMGTLKYCDAADGSIFMLFKGGFRVSVCYTEHPIARKRTVTVETLQG